MSHLDNPIIAASACLRREQAKSKRLFAALSVPSKIFILPSSAQSFSALPTNNQY